MVRLEGLGKLKHLNGVIGTRTRDLSACSIAPQPSTLPRTPGFCRRNCGKDLRYTRVLLEGGQTEGIFVLMQKFIEQRD
jgi:hypothetical protein